MCLLSWLELITPLSRKSLLRMKNEKMQWRKKTIKEQGLERKKMAIPVAFRFYFVVQKKARSWKIVL